MRINNFIDYQAWQMPISGRNFNQYSSWSLVEHLNSAINEVIQHIGFNKWKVKMLSQKKFIVQPKNLLFIFVCNYVIWKNTQARCCQAPCSCILNASLKCDWLNFTARKINSRVIISYPVARWKNNIAKCVCYIILLHANVDDKPWMSKINNVQFLIVFALAFVMHWLWNLGHV